jgi:hypothetical protein
MSTLEEDYVHGLRAQRAGNGNSIMTAHDPSTMVPAHPATTNEIETPPPTDLSTEDEDDSASDVDTINLQDVADEDAQSIFQVSMSRAASRLTSSRTPAAERAAAMQSAGDYFDVNDEGEDNSGESTPSLAAQSSKPAQKLDVPGPEPGNRETKLPSPGQAQPKPIGAERSDESRSALKDAFHNRRRSLSGGMKGLLPKALPSMISMPKASSLFPSLPSPSFFASYTQKRIGAGSKDRTGSKTGDGGSRVQSPIQSPYNTTMSREGSSQGTATPTSLTVSTEEETSGTSNLRRATSHESLLLYHTLSRASSLGDDSRFEHHHVQVNSRAKAIRDSLQDRSTFRMPTVSMPSMPRLPKLLADMNFSLSHLYIALSPTGMDTDLIQDILPGATKKKPAASSNPSIASRMADSSTSRSDMPTDAAQSILDGPPAQHLERATENLTGDVVIMGGYRGSVLRSSKTNRQVWVPVKVGMNIRKVNLEVGLESEDEENMEDHIYPSGMLTNIGPVDISKRLFKRLREGENAKNGKLRIWDYGYDWRLSPHLLSRRLIAYLEKLPCNQPGVPEKERGALVIAHSLGGLITRHAVNQRPELFSGVIYAGVPQTCVNILGPLRNGDAVLFSQRVLTAQVNFTLRTSFLLLPVDGYCFINKQNPNQEYPVDFFNVDDWIKYRWSPCTDPPLPPLSQPTGPLGSLINISGSLPSLPIIGRHKSSTTLSSLNGSSANSNSSNSGQAETSTSRTTQAANKLREIDHGKDRTIAPQMGNLSNPVNSGNSTKESVSTHVTIPREKAIAYLSRILPEIKRFKLETMHDPALEKANRYPPIAVLYGKNIPTVYGARVSGEDGIARADVYEDLAFASGDGVVLAKMAMLPKGYRVVVGGRVPSERGHVSLLGDLIGVGRCISAIRLGRERGIGLGNKSQD